MKGWIEVNKEPLRMLINVTTGAVIKESNKNGAPCHFYCGHNRFDIKETYDELKAKIQEASE